MTNNNAGREPPAVNDGRVVSPTPGDKPVDSVDKPVLNESPGVTGYQNDGASSTQSSGDVEHTNVDGAGHELRGSDLARAALQAARERSAAKSSGLPKGKKPAARSSGDSPSSRRRRWSGPRNDDRDPQPLGRVVSRLAVDRGWNGRLANGQVFGNWASLVGEEVAEHAQPLSLHNGELTVQASSTAWATQLRLLQSQLLAKIAKGVGHGVVKRLKVQGPVAPSWRRGHRHVPGRGPRDTYG